MPSVLDKQARVTNFQRNTVESFVELMGACGIENPEKINRTHVYRRVFMNMVKTYEDIYPTIPDGCLLEGRGKNRRPRLHQPYGCNLRRIFLGR